MKAVFYFKRLADRTLLGAGTHSARRYALRVSDLNGRVSNGALEPILPKIQVNGWNCCARNARVQERIRDVKQRALNVAHAFTVVADHTAQTALADFRKLSFRKPEEWIVSLIPESVTFPQVPELDS